MDRRSVVYPTSSGGGQYRSNGFTRRQLMTGAAAMGLASAIGRPALARTGDPPLRLGLVTSLSGPFASLGENMRSGLKLMLAESGQQFAGRSVELLVEDDQAKPDEGVRKVRKLVGQDKVDVVCGVISSAVALAIRDVVTEAKVLTFLSIASANDLARGAASPFIFRPTKTNWMLGHTAGMWAYEKVAKSGGVTFAADYAAGRECVGDFVASYQQQGGKIGKQLWTPLGTADFGPLLTQIAAEQPTFVYSFFAGSDAVRFLQQMQDFRLTGKIGIVGTGALFDQEDVLPAVGDAALGGVSTFHQSPTAQSSAKFVGSYREQTGKLPGEASTAGYTTGQVIKAAVEVVQGDLSNTTKVKEAILSQPIETVLGPMRFDPRNNQAILDIYVNEVRKGEDGKPVNTVISTYKDIRDPGPVG